MTELSNRLSAAWRTLCDGAPAPLSRNELGTIAVSLALTFPVWVRRRKTA